MVFLSQILFIFGTVINYNRGFVQVKYTSFLCQNVAFMSIMSQMLFVVIYQISSLKIPGSLG